MPEETKEVDEKGVPIENRMREMERKLQEKYDREISATRKELEELRAGMQQSKEEPVKDDAIKAELMELVKSPKAFTRAVAAEVMVERELGNVRPWLESQSGYNRDDNERLMSIENEYQLSHPSPLERAKAAWSILRNEKLASKATAQSDDQKREASVSKTTPDGTGKATSKHQEVTRADIVKKLAAAEAKGDLDASIKYLDMLEDIRE